MKKINFLLTLAVALLGATWANAETVSPYTVDFNTTISTSSNDFKVASYWGHVTSGYFDEDDWETYYPTYTYMESAGVDGTGCLKCGTQTAVGSGTSYYTGSTTDLLVTPKVTGDVTIKVKQVYSTGTVKFYTCTKSGTAYSKGSQISVTLPTLSTDEFVTVTVSGLEGVYLGIYGSNVYLDDFSAPSAELESTRALTINKVTSKSTYADCDANGDFTINYTVNITNTGDVDFAAGDADFALSFINYSTKDTLGKTPITTALAVGDTIDVPLAVTLNYANYPKRNRYDVYEWASYTSIYGSWIEPIVYAPDVSVRNESGFEMETANGNSYATTFGAFGMIGEPTSKTFIVRNDGAAPFVGTLEAPEGFSVSKTALNLAAHVADTLTLTALGTTPGIFNGDLKAISGDTTTWYVTLSATVRDLNKFFEDFEGNKGVDVLPSGWWDVDNDWDKTTYTSTLMDNYARADVLVEHILWTPLLKVTEGEKMTFDASKRSTSSFINVLYSADRRNWTLVKEVANSELGTAGTSSKNPTYNTIVVEGIPAGNYYIGFSSGYASIDNVYGFEAVPVTQDIEINGQNIPATGMVNSELTPTVDVINLLEDSVAASDYTVAFYFNGEKVADCTTSDLAGRGTATLNASYTPHEEGTFPAYFVLTLANGDTRTSDTINIIIAAEQATAEYTVGSAEGAAGAAPIATNYKNSVYEALYTAEQLAEAGIKEGDKITSLTYYGYFTAADSWTIENANFYMMECEDSVYGDADITDASTMTQVFSGEITVTKGGSSGNYVRLMTITFAEPFTYNGKALRIRSQAEQSSYKNIYFTYDSSISGQCYGNRSDNTKLDAFSSFYTVSFPVTTFGIQLIPDTLSGIVTDSITGAPLAGVSVEVNGTAVETETTGNAPRRAAQLKYTGTTDENGKYAIAIIQTEGNTFEATYSREGYITKTVALTAIGTTDVALVPEEKEAENIYVIKAIEGNTWNLTSGELMSDTVVDTDNQLILNLNGMSLAAVNGDKGYFGFTTKLASADDAWTEIAEYRLGPVSEETNFVANDYINTEFEPTNIGNAQYITMIVGDKFIQAPAGTYDLYIELTPASSEAPIQPMSVALAGSNMRLFMVNPNSTGVTEMPADLGIASVKYYDLNGVELAEPTTGVNIRVITYDNGTTRAIKVLK